MARGPVTEVSKSSQSTCPLHITSMMRVPQSLNQRSNSVADIIITKSQTITKER